MVIKPISDDFSVVAQISPSDVAQIKAQGFKSVICNRPDGEAAGQPAEQLLVDQLTANGLAFRSIPFTAGRQTAQDIADFGQAINDLPTPVLAFCRTGTRSATIWAQSQVQQLGVDQVVKVTTAAGFNFEPLRPALVALAKQGD